MSGKSSRRISFPQVRYFMLSCNCFTLLACICLFKVNNGNTRMSTLNRFQAFFYVSIVDFEQINAGRDITIMQSICVHMFLRNGYSGKYGNQSKLPVMATFLVLFNEAELYSELWVFPVGCFCIFLCNTSRSSRKLHRMRSSVKFLGK